jgi:peptidoglycan/xylan/chitin deacetylase (PgdA/CDA1 family)
MINRIKNKLISEGVIRPKNQKGRKCIIMYHGIDKFEDMSFNRRFFSENNFEKQLKYYKKNYNVISLSDYFEDLNLRTDRVNIAITFDDGYMNNLKYALPLLEKYSLYATFFITGLNNNNQNILWADLVEICSYYMTANEISFDNQKFKRNSLGKFSELMNYIKLNPIADKPLFEELKDELIKLSKIDLNKTDLLDYWELLSPDSIKLIGNSKYVKVGSHGFYHNNLGNIDINDACEEITKSKAYLESLTQYEINSIGYPDGSYSNLLATEALEIGYKYQCAVDYRFKKNEDLSYLSNRIGLYPSSTIYSINQIIQNFAYEHSNIYEQ